MQQDANNNKKNNNKKRYILVALKTRGMVKINKSDSLKSPKDISFDMFF